MTRRKFLGYSGLFVAGIAAYAACGPETTSTPTPTNTLAPTPTPKYEDSFMLGSTAFEFDSTWNDMEKAELYDLYTKAYPILQEFYGAEPTDMQEQTGVKIQITKDTTLPTKPDILYGKREFSADGKAQTIGLRDSRNHYTAIHELGHAFWGLLALHLDIYDEGFPDAAAFVVGDAIGEDYTRNRRQQARITVFDPQIFNKPKLATYARFNDNLTLHNIRQLLSGDAWYMLYGQDSDFFKKFRQEMYKAFPLSRKTSMDAVAFRQIVRNSFSGDFESFVATQPILSEPPIYGFKDYVAFAPTVFSGEEGLSIVAYRVEGTIEHPLKEVAVELSITDMESGHVIFSGSNRTNEKGVTGFIPVESRQNHKFVATTSFDTDELILQLHNP